MISRNDAKGPYQSLLDVSLLLVSGLSEDLSLNLKNSLSTSHSWRFAA